MRIGMAIWGRRISPVFDVARRLVVFEAEGDQVLARSDIELSDGHMEARARELADHGVEVLLCGALSRDMARALTQHSIRVVSQLCGRAEAVLEAFLSDGLDTGRFLRPGCRRRRCGNRGPAGRGRSRGTRNWS